MSIFKFDKIFYFCYNYNRNGGFIMAGLPKCVVCKKEINKYSVDYYRVTDGFIHLECAEGYKKLHPKAKKFELKERIEQDDAFINKTMDYLTELGMEINFSLFQTQRKKYIRTFNYTNEGIYNAVRYFYGVKKNSIAKGNGGIGIVPYVYIDAEKYFKNLEKQKNEINKSMKNQLYKEDKVIHLKKEKIKKDKGYIDLDSIGGD